MKCPHCQTSFHPQTKLREIGTVGKIDGEDCAWRVESDVCPTCEKPILTLSQMRKELVANIGVPWVMTVVKTFMIFPKGTGRPPAPPEVQADIAADFNEACLVLADSPKASAALSRRCLEQLLHERNVSTKHNLSEAIDDALAKHLPSHIGENLDAVRNIGLFDAHPKKSSNSGEILDVEPGEAEWNLDVLESLFDYYYVQPAKSAKKREALDKKLAEAGKKPMKKP